MDDVHAIIRLPHVRPGDPAAAHAQSPGPFRGDADLEIPAAEDAPTLEREVLGLDRVSMFGPHVQEVTPVRGLASACGPGRGAPPAPGRQKGRPTAVGEGEAGRATGGRSAYSVRPTAPAITRACFMSSWNSCGVSDCRPSESALSG